MRRWIAIWNEFFNTKFTHLKVRFTVVVCCFFSRFHFHFTCPQSLTQLITTKLCIIKADISFSHFKSLIRHPFPLNALSTWCTYLDTKPHFNPTKSHFEVFKFKLCSRWNLTKCRFLWTLKTKNIKIQSKCFTA